MIYASMSKGFRSGGYNGRAATPFSATLAFKPEDVTAYELGFKSELLDNRVTFNVAAFYTDYKDMQQSTTIPVPNPPFNETIVGNAAGAKIKGVEADLTAKPAEGLILRGSLGYTDSKFSDFLTSQLVNGELRVVDASDVNLLYAPKLTLGASGEYNTPVGPGELRFNGSYRHLSPYDQSIVPLLPSPIPATGPLVSPGSDPRVRSDAQDIVDLSLSYLLPAGPGEARITGFVRNLLDDRGTANSFPVAGLWTFVAAREPRVFGVQLGYEF